MYKILIAEDEEIIRRGVCKALNWADVGCEICGAVENGAEAIECLAACAPDIVLCDIRMPEQSGLDVAAYIQRHKLECKILLLTGYSDFSYAQQAISFGVFDYLLKPVSPEALTAAIFRATAALDEARASRREQPAPTQGTDTDALLTRLLLGEISPSSPAFAQTAPLELSSLRFTLALIPCEAIQKNAGKHPLPPEKLHLLARLFSTAAQRASFHRLLPAIDGAYPLCVGYVGEPFRPFFCWELLQAEYSHEAHAKLTLTVCALDANLAGLREAYRAGLAALVPALPAQTASGRPIVASILNYLWAHYAGPVKLTDVAEHVFLNPSYISRIVCRETGMSFIDHLLFIRVQEAKRLLLTSPLRTFEIAEKTGFGSAKYFGQVFRRQTGMSPSEYRARAGVPPPAS